MVKTHFTAIVGLAAVLVAKVTATINTSGFLDPLFSSSVGGYATCVNGIIPVSVTDTHNVQLNFSVPTNETQAAQLILDWFTANSTLIAQVSGPDRLITQQFNISGRLCYPKNAASHNHTTVQFLTHGIGFAQSYWDFASPSNSYIDFAAQAGQATFSYDRLGVGESSHPDPVQVVQGAVQVSIAHSLVGLLRNGKLSATKFSHVVGVGHSYGSEITTAIAGTYPSDFDALILTGVSNAPTGIAPFFAAQNVIPASLDRSERFVGLDDGYILASTIYGVQYAFFYSPFETSILAQAFATGQTTTWGELFTMDKVGNPAANYTGSVYVVNGLQDLVFCDGNCEYPSNVALSTLNALFPAAKNTSDVFLLPNSGHGVNLAANAPLAFEKIQSFISHAGL